MTADGDASVNKINVDEDDDDVYFQYFQPLSIIYFSTFSILPIRFGYFRLHSVIFGTVGHILSFSANVDYFEYFQNTHSSYRHIRYSSSDSVNSGHIRSFSVLSVTFYRSRRPLSIIFSTFSHCRSFASLNFRFWCF